MPRSRDGMHRSRSAATAQAVVRPLSRLHRPDDMSLDAWQAALRRQFGREQGFLLANLGAHPIFSEFEVSNPKSRRAYRVVIRSGAPGSNFCACPDFATNTLGTCKHIEFTLARLERKGEARAALARGFEPPCSEVYLSYGARREVRFRPRAGAPAALLELAAQYVGADGTLRPDAFGRFEGFLSAAARLDPGLRCYEDVLALVAQVRDAERRSARLAEAFPRGHRSAGFSDLLRVPLYEYQREAALFAARAGRCLVGDEMGLGKTIEAIAAVEIMARHFGVERVLIVCPTSLKHQWEREIARVIGRSTCVIGGSRRSRQEGFRGERFYKITNYDTIARDLDLVAGWAPDLVILDEAQRIKNWSTRTARSVKKIASPYAIVLTGTPIENRLQELVSIVEFVDLHRLGPTFRFLHAHQILDESGKVVGYRDLDAIGKTLAPILLRRRKREVLSQLPERLEKRLFVPMTAPQMEHHEENREVVGKIVAKWRRFRFLSEADQRRLMIALQNMRMACDSTYLLDQKTDDGVKADEVATLLDEIFEQPGTKAVIFSQWLRMHEVLVRRLERKKWGHVLFHGSLDIARRRTLVDRFREDPRCRAFLSTDAGGVGLNLQHASVVVNVDLPWNPAVLEQRIGRVHRLGQNRPVQVISFVAKGTIEEGMLAVLGFKRSLFAGVLDGGEREVFLGGTRLTRFMDSVEKVADRIRAPGVEEPPGERASAREEQRRPQRGGASGNGGDAAAPDAAEEIAGAARVSDPLAGLLQAGLALLTQLAGPAARPIARSADGADHAPPFERIRDERTGRSYLKVRIPEPGVIDRVAQALQELLGSLRA